MTADSVSTCRFEVEDGYCVVELQPELNKAPWGEIDSIGNSVLERINSIFDGSRKQPSLLLDLSALNYMGSAMVALTVRLWKAANSKNAKTIVINDDEMVLEVLRLSGLEERWTIVDTRESAMKTLGISPPPKEEPEAEAPPESTGVTPTAGGTVAPAAPSSRGSLFAVAAILLTLISAAGLFLFHGTTPLIEDVRVTQGMLFGGAILGLVMATAAAAAGCGVTRTTGILCLIACLALLVIGFALHPQRDVLLENKQEIKATPPPTRETDDEKTQKSPQAEDKKTPGKAEQKSDSNAKSASKKSGPVTAPKPKRAAD